MIHKQPCDTKSYFSSGLSVYLITSRTLTYLLLCHIITHLINYMYNSPSKKARSLRMKPERRTKSKTPCYERKVRGAWPYLVTFLDIMSVFVFALLSFLHLILSWFLIRLIINLILFQFLSSQFHFFLHDNSVWDFGKERQGHLGRSRNTRRRTTPGIEP